MTSPDSGDIHVRFGRVSIWLPVSHIVTDCSAVIGSTAVYDQALEDPAPQAGAAIWTDLLEMARDEGWNIRRDEVVNNLKVAHCARSGEPFPQQRLALAISEGAALILTSGQLDDDTAVHEALRGFAELAAVYRPSIQPASGGSASVRRDLFHLQYGAIELPCRDTEEIDASVLLAGKRVELQLFTSIVSEPERGNAAESLQDLVSLRDLAKHGISLQVMRAGPSRNGKFAGYEAVYRLESLGEPPTLTFRWTFSGQPESGTAPAIEVEMSAPADMAEVALELWDRITVSIKSVDDGD